jgi:hypothetical protein
MATNHENAGKLSSPMSAAFEKPQRIAAQYEDARLAYLRQ